MKPRTRARWLALQVLYEFDMTNHPPGEIFQSRLDEEVEDPALTDEVIEFARLIVFGVVPITQQLDEIIAAHAPEWPLDQVAAIDRNIIRIAIWEYAVEKCTPKKVAINEAVETAKIFGADAAPRFVNGVLGSLIGKVEQVNWGNKEE